MNNEISLESELYIMNKICNIARDCIDRIELQIERGGEYDDLLNRLVDCKKAMDYICNNGVCNKQLILTAILYKQQICEYLEKYRKEVK